MVITFLVLNVMVRLITHRNARGIVIVCERKLSGAEDGNFTESGLLIGL